MLDFGEMSRQLRTYNRYDFFFIFFPPPEGGPPAAPVVKVNSTYKVWPELHVRPAQKPVKTRPNHLKIKIPIVQNLYFLQNQAELDLKIFYYDRI